MKDHEIDAYTYQVPDLNPQNRLKASLLAALSVVAMLQVVPPVGIETIGGAPPVPAICDDPRKVVSQNINLGAGIGNTEIVAGSGTLTIYVCGYQLQASGADGTQWITGGTDACVTGETDKVTFANTANGDGAVVSGGGAVVFSTAAGGELCVERTNSVALSGFVWYVQQQAPS